MSDPQWPHGLQPSRLFHPWDFPGKSTGAGCHCLLRTGVPAYINAQLKVSCCCCSVTQSFPTLCNSMDCSMPGLPVPHHLLISISSVIPSSHFILWCLFSPCPQSFPASGTFPMCHLFTSDDQKAGTSASVLPTSIQGWFPLRLTGLISLQSKC